MKKNILLFIFFISFCNFLGAVDSEERNNSIWNTLKNNTKTGLVYARNNPIQVLGTALIGGSTLYTAHQVGAEKLLWHIGKTLTHYEYYPSVLSLSAIGFFVRFATRYHNLEKIQKDADSGDTFRMWCIAGWNTAFDLKKNKDAVEENLKKTVSKENKKENLGKLRKEKEQIEEWIRIVGSLSHFPEDLVQQIINDGKKIAVDHSYFWPCNGADRAINAASYLRDLDIKLDCDAPLLQSNANSFFYCKHWFNPLTWTVAPCPQKARTLCAKLIRYYGRLLVIEDIMQGMEFETSAQKFAALVDPGNVEVQIKGKI